MRALILSLIALGFVLAYSNTAPLPHPREELKIKKITVEEIVLENRLTLKDTSGKYGVILEKSNNQVHFWIHSEKGYACFSVGDNAHPVFSFRSADFEHSGPNFSLTLDDKIPQVQYYNGDSVITKSLID